MIALWSTRLCLSCWLCSTIFMEVKGCFKFLDANNNQPWTFCIESYWGSTCSLRNWYNNQLKWIICHCNCWAFMDAKQQEMTCCWPVQNRWQQKVWGKKINNQPAPAKLIKKNVGAGCAPSECNATIKFFWIGTVCWVEGTHWMDATISWSVELVCVAAIIAEASLTSKSKRLGAIISELSLTQSRKRLGSWVAVLITVPSLTWNSKRLVGVASLWAIMPLAACK